MRRTWRQPMVLLSLMLAAMFALSACAPVQRPAPAPAPSPGPIQPPAPAPAPAPKPAALKSITFSMWNSPLNMNPLNSTDWYAQLAVWPVYERLVILDQHSKFAPGLAEKWDVAPDFKSLTLTLTNKAKWSDGTPVTAHDVKFSWDLASHPDVPTKWGSGLLLLEGTDAKTGKAPDGNGVSGIVVNNDYSITFKYKSPTYPVLMLDHLVRFVIPKHVVSKIDPKNVDTWDGWKNHPVTNGPFKWNRYVTDSHVEYDANKDYWRGAPKVDKIFLKIVKADVMLAGLEKGEIDYTIAGGTGDIVLDDWERAQKLPNIQAISFPERGYQFMQQNAAQPGLDSAKGRQAILHGINRQLMVQRLLFGAGEVVDGPYTSTHPYRDGNLKITPYDPAKAKALAAEAGIKAGQEMTLFFPSGNVVRMRSAPFIAENLKESIGLNVKTRQFGQLADQLALQQKERDDKLPPTWHFALSGFGPGLDPDITSTVGTAQTYNYMRYSNATLDDLLAKGRTTARTEDRRVIYNQIQKILQDEVPIAYLYSANALAAMSTRLVGAVAPHVNKYPINVHLWDVK